MKTRKVTAALALIAVAIITITISRAQTNKTSAVPPEKAVLARLNDIQEAAQALDADKVFSFVLDNRSGALAQNGRLFLTRSDALESTRRGFQRLQTIHYQFDQQHVTMLSPTIALATGEGVSSATALDGQSFTNRFAQSVVLVLTNGEWEVFHAHRSFPAGN
jgi:hypothetical protein